MNSPAHGEDLSRVEEIKKSLTEVWVLLEPYRLGFGLGLLAVSSTLALILTGQKSEKLNYQTKWASPRAQEVSNAKEAGNVNTSVLGVQEEPATPAAMTKVSKPTATKFVSSDKVNINKASLAALDTLPQIGPITAQRIIDYRSARGSFKSIEELDNIKGIGPKTIEKIRNLVTVE